MLASANDQPGTAASASLTEAPATPADIQRAHIYRLAAANVEGSRGGLNSAFVHSAFVNCGRCAVTREAHGGSPICVCTARLPWQGIPLVTLELMRILSSLPNLSVYNFMRGFGTHAETHRHTAASMTCHQILGAALLIPVIQSLHRQGLGDILTGLGGRPCLPVHGMSSLVLGGVDSFIESPQSRLQLGIRALRSSMERGRGLCTACSYIHALDSACPNCGSTIWLPITAAACRVLEYARGPTPPCNSQAIRSLLLAMRQLGVPDPDSLLTLAITVFPAQQEMRPAVPDAASDTLVVGDRWTRFARHFEDNENFREPDGSFTCPFHDGLECTCNGPFAALHLLLLHLQMDHPDEVNWPIPSARIRSPRAVTSSARAHQDLNEAARSRRFQLVNEQIEVMCSIRRQLGFDPRQEREFTCQQDNCYHIYHLPQDLLRHATLCHPCAPAPCSVMEHTGIASTCGRCCGLGCDEVDRGRAWYPQRGLFACTRTGCDRLVHSMQSLINHDCSHHPTNSGSMAGSTACPVPDCHETCQDLAHLINHIVFVHPEFFELLMLDLNGSRRHHEDGDDRYGPGGAPWGFSRPGLHAPEDAHVRTCRSAR